MLRCRIDRAFTRHSLLNLSFYSHLQWQGQMTNALCREAVLVRTLDRLTAQRMGLPIWLDAVWGPKFHSSSKCYLCHYHFRWSCSNHCSC